MRGFHVRWTSSMRLRNGMESSPSKMRHRRSCRHIGAGRPVPSGTRRRSVSMRRRTCYAVRAEHSSSADRTGSNGRSCYVTKGLIAIASCAARSTSTPGLIEELSRRGVHTVFHYVPLHSAPAGHRYGRVQGELVETDRVSGRLVRLPLWYAMPDEAVERVISAVTEVLTSD